MLSCFYCEHFQGKCCGGFGFGLVFIAGLGDVLLLLLLFCYLCVCTYMGFCLLMCLFSCFWVLCFVEMGLSVFGQIALKLDM